MSIDANRKTVEQLWAALSDRDWETLKSCLSEDVHYEDVPTEDPGARGPENVVKRLAIAFDHLIDHQHTIHHLVCEGDVVFLDHTEVWTFKTGEKATNQFATLHEMRDGRVTRWSDYWDVSGFVGQFPAWFLEEMARHTAADFGNDDRS
jgi:ketosteroid isomerase-like protein